MGKTKIEWTDCTWNVCTGCTKVSAGCLHCYAERMAMRRMSPEWQTHIEPTQFHETVEAHLRKFTDIQCHPERLEQPLHWRKPRKVFVNSMVRVGKKLAGRMLDGREWNEFPNV
jgi:protein gp37